ncbi:MAG: Rrf2 family transcriptional regulator, partial [Thiohalospira sp.]
ISLSYLEQLMSQLRRHDLVRSVRGPGGGYSLSRPASEISVADIITAVDEPLQATRCGGEENCQEGERCLTHELWNDLSHRLYEFLDGITLDAYVQREDVQEVIRRQKSRQGQRNNMRRIRAA